MIYNNCKSGEVMETIHFTKMQGCGNDFVILDYPEYKKSRIFMADLARTLCDRHFGVGADGLIIPDYKSKNADIGWYFYNSDGSTAQMCGNGMRCFAKYLYDRKIIEKEEFTVQTGAGVITPQILPYGEVTVKMSVPVLDPALIPFLGEKSLNYSLVLKDIVFTGNAVSMGNPHFVIFTAEKTMDMAKKYGPEIEVNPLFPEKTNVEFVRIISKNEIELSVWERGCGITLACGTGACASVVAGILNNLTESKVLVNLPGGAATIEWQGLEPDANVPVFLTGPANYSFEGDFVL